MASFLPAVLEFSAVGAGHVAAASSTKTGAGRCVSRFVAQHATLGLNQDFAINAIVHMDLETYPRACPAMAKGHRRAFVF